LNGAPIAILAESALEKKTDARLRMKAAAELAN
jgi:hypothetical protein